MKTNTAVKYYFKYLAIAALLCALYGFLCPWLISLSDDLAPLIGMIAAFSFPAIVFVVVYKDIKLLIQKSGGKDES